VWAIKILSPEVILVTLICHMTIFQNFGFLAPPQVGPKGSNFKIFVWAIKIFSPEVILVTLICHMTIFSKFWFFWPHPKWGQKGQISKFSFGPSKFLVLKLFWSL